jgi:hypothetical protein
MDSEIYKYDYIKVFQNSEWKGENKMLKRYIALFFSILLTGCSVGPKDNPCKDQIPIPPIPRSSILSYLNSKIGETEFKPDQGGKTFCSYEPIYAEKKGNQIKYYINVGCSEVDAELKEGTGGTIEVLLTIEQKGDQYHIVSHFVPGLATYMEDVKKYFPLEKMNCGLANSEDSVDIGKEILDQAKQYFEHSHE